MYPIVKFRTEKSLFAYARHVGRRRGSVGNLENIKALGRYFDPSKVTHELVIELVIFLTSKLPRLKARRSRVRNNFRCHC